MKFYECLKFSSKFSKKDVSENFYLAPEKIDVVYYGITESIGEITETVKIMLNLGDNAPIPLFLD